MVVTPHSQYGKREVVEPKQPNKGLQVGAKIATFIRFSKISLENYVL